MARNKKRLVLRTAVAFSILHFTCGGTLQEAGRSSRITAATVFTGITGTAGVHVCPVRIETKQNETVAPREQTCVRFFVPPLSSLVFLPPPPRSHVSPCCLSLFVMISHHV
jgi:hypothetical protein